MMKKGCVLTPHANYSLPGITRAIVRKRHSFLLFSFTVMAKQNFILEERRISLSEFHTVDEVWTT
ncbi:unnamed protein product [Arabidopsis lyrata]|nr:unnamed protein product [Arabidopsis lyrata]